MAIVFMTRGLSTCAVFCMVLAAPQNAAFAQTTSGTQPARGASDPGQQAPVSQESTQTTDGQLAPLFFNVTVSAASRTQEEIKDTPQAVTVATSQSIERRQARTPNQMLRGEPGVWSVLVSAQGSPIIRGQIGNRVLYMWDGIRLNNGALFSGPNGFFNQFPVGAVDRMEVIRGPGAVQYGSDAIGGVINVVERQNDAFTSTLQAGGDVNTRYGSVDGEKTAYGNVWVSTNRISLFGGATGQDLGDYKVPGGDVMRNTGMHDGGGHVNLAVRVNDTDRFKVAWIHNRRFDVGTYTQSKLNPGGIPRIQNPFEQRGVVRVDYDMQHPQSAVSQVRFYGYGQYYTSARNTLVETTALLNRTRVDTDQKVVGGGAQAVSLLGRSRLVYGGDFRAEKLTSDRTLNAESKATRAVTTTIPNGNVPRGTYNVADGFAMLHLPVTQALSWSVGLRAESTNLRSDPRPQDALTPFTVADLKLDKRWNSLTWSTGTVYRVRGNWSVAANVASGYRAPTFSDTLSTGVPVFASGVASVPSPGAGPERSITYEAGPRYDSSALNVSLTVYTNQLTDLLTSIPSGTIDIPGVGVVQALARGNISSAYVRGVETAFEYRVLPTLSVFANATVTRGQDTFLNVPLRFIPPANGLAGMLYESSTRSWWVEGNVMIADRLHRHAPQDELDAGFSMDPAFGSPSATNPPLPGFQIPGWTMATLRGGATVWKGGQDGRQRVELTLDLNNVLNAKYREAYSQQQLYAPSFGAVFGARVRF